MDAADDNVGDIPENVLCLRCCHVTTKTTGKYILIFLCIYVKG